MPLIKLSKQAFFHNLKQIETVVDRSKIAIVLKDNAYGHGIIEMATLSKEYGIKKAIVRTVLEAKQIENYFDFILILADLPNELNSKFHITINSLEDIRKIPKKSNVQLKIDTGMHRNGIDEEDIEIALKEIRNQDLELTAVFSHSRSSDELSSEAFWQLKNFRRIIKDIDSPSFHFSNSASTFRFKNYGVFDMVRIGLAAYGYSENDDSIGSFDLKPVLSLWANKISSRTLKKHTRVGYGGSFETDEDLKISTYDLGYGDGFFRLTQKHNYITPKGFKILGRVSMDSVSIDSNDNEICIFNDCTELSKLFNTISYEILVKLQNNINRIIDE